MIRREEALEVWLVKVREDRRRLEVGAMAGSGPKLRLVVVALEGLEICLRSRNWRGIDGCLGLLEASLEGGAR